MFKTYFKVAWRNLLKSKGSSFINISGLAIGMSVSMLIGLWIYDELTFDTWHQHYNRIAQVMQHQTFNGSQTSQNSIPAPLGKELVTNYGNDFKYVAMASWQGSYILSYDDKKINQTGMYMDKDGPNMLTLTMLKGTRNGLVNPHSILLSAATAKALFGNEEPVGKVLKIANRLPVQVTGVYADLPYATTFRDLHFIAPWELYVSSEEWVQESVAKSRWGNNSFQLFAQIADNTDFNTVNKHIANAKLNHVPAEDKKYKPLIYLHPMRNWHLRSHWDDNGIQTGGAIEYVKLFSVVAIFVLLLACINFMNLSTARSEKRAREVGIRKAIGSLRSQLVRQFYSESLLVVVFAFVLAIMLVVLTLPWFNNIAAKKMHIPWGSPLCWLSAIGFILLTGVVAGSYPALYLSSFQPVKVLKGTFKGGRLAAIPRKVLVVFQFTISLALIIGTIVVYNQIQYAKNRPIGYNRNSLMAIMMKSNDYKGKFQLLRTDLKSAGVIEEMAESSSPLTGVWSNNGGFSWQGKDPNLDGDFATIWITPEFGKTVGWEFKAGRDLSRSFLTDSSAVVINEAAVKFMGIKDPIGTQIKWGDGGTFTIVGVIKDMLMDSPYGQVKQTLYFLGKDDDANWMEFKLNPNKSASQCVAAIEAAFKKYMPAVPFDYKFVDDEFAAKFASEERIGKLSAFFAALAVFISCLGLFGLSSYIAEQRTKEIGIRKILGASVTNLWGMLSKDFVLMVIIGCMIAVPIAWYFMHQWLMNYQYRIGISWWIFLIAGTGALLITLLTVSFQAIRAALANPVQSLRSE